MRRLVGLVLALGLAAPFTVGAVGMVGALGCGAAPMQQGPSDALRSYARALEEGRVDDAYKLLSDDARRSVSLEAFRRMVKENPDEVREIARALARPASDPVVTATVIAPHGERLAWRHVFRFDVARTGGGDVHCHIPAELLKVRGAGHKIGLAVDLDERSEPAVMVDVGLDPSLAGDPSLALLRHRGPALAKEDSRLGLVASGGFQRASHVTDGRTSLVTKRLNRFEANFHGAAGVVVASLGASLGLPWPFVAAPVSA